MSDTTPTARKNGGVAIPYSLMKTKSTGSEKAAASDAQVAWKGPKAESSADEPFGHGSSKQLQAGAASFQPASSSTALSKPAPIMMLNEGSEPDTLITTPVILDSSAALRPNGIVKDKKPIGPIGSSNGNVPANPQGLSKVSKSFTGDIGKDVNLQYPGGHFIKVEYVEQQDLRPAVDILNEQYHWKTKVTAMKFVESGDNTKYLTVLFCFNDLRDAAEAENDVSIVRQNWRVDYVPEVVWAAQAMTDPLPLSGQIVFSAEWTGDMEALNTTNLRYGIQGLASHFGELYAFAKMLKPNSRAIEYRAEYYKISDAQKAIEYLMKEQPTVHSWAIYPGKWAKFPGSSPDTPQKGARETSIYTSPSGRSAWSYDEDGNKRWEQPPRVVPKFTGPLNRGVQSTPSRDRFHSAPQPETPAMLAGVADQPRSNSHAVDQYYATEVEPQAVSIARIEKGHDCRTTIMLRNIPNRWTCHDLHNCLNLTSFGKYDFSYLRIDFEQNTNVGYAFVNFVEPMAIVPFVKHYVGKDWAEGYSRRTAQVSYATVQGFDCLVEKFRNSSIMDENPDFVPKLWWTEQNAPNVMMIGTNKSFPEANNVSKKQRSSDNAAAIGLYPPRLGNRAGGDRTRRSNYDRGTPRQIQEDAAYNAQNSPVDDSWAQGGMSYLPNQAPVGTPYVQQPFYGQLAQFPAGPPVAPMHFVDPFASGYAAPYYPHPPAYHYGYQHVVNPASQLRTLSQGRLGGRPKNVVVGDTLGMYTQQPNVPRAFAEQPQASGYVSNGVQASVDVADDSQQYMQLFQ